MRVNFARAFLSQKSYLEAPRYKSGLTLSAHRGNFFNITSLAAEKWQEAFFDRAALVSATSRDEIDAAHSYVILYPDVV